MKVLMVGLGGIGQRHLRNLLALVGADLEILAYRTRRLRQVLTDQLQVEPASDLEEKYNIQVYTELQNALEQKPEVVFVTNPSSMHIPVALEAAKANCNLFIEKPLSHNLEGVEELIKLVEDRKLVALVGYQMRFHPCLQRLHSLLQQEAVGRILSVQVEVGEYLPRWHTYEDYRQMYASRSDLGGGVILSQIHELDYIYWLFGLPRRIFALGGHLSDLEIDVEDVASILMECVIAGRPVPVQIQQDYLQRPPTRQCKIIGTKGKILVDFYGLSVYVFNSKGEAAEKYEYNDFLRNQLFIDELKHLLACLQGREEPLVNLRHAVQSLRMALAAKESLETAKVVELR